MSRTKRRRPPPQKTPLAEAQAREPLARLDADAVNRADQERIAGLPQDAQKLSFTAEFYRGSLPHPSIMAGYEQISPGSFDRILVMAERQQNHRHSLEKMVVEYGIKRSTWGLVTGFVVAMAFMGMCFLLITQGRTVEGTVGGTLDVGALVSLFVVGRMSQRKELTDKERIRQETAAGQTVPSSRGKGRR